MLFSSFFCHTRKDNQVNKAIIFNDVLVQDYGKFKLEPEGGVYGTKKNRYYFDRVQ